MKTGKKKPRRAHVDRAIGAKKPKSRRHGKFKSKKAGVFEDVPKASQRK